MAEVSLMASPGPPLLTPQFLQGTSRQRLGQVTGSVPIYFYYFYFFSKMHFK